MQCELSLTALYLGQVLWLDVLKRLRSSGFEVESLIPVFADPDSGRLLQVDAILFRGSSG